MVTTLRCQFWLDKFQTGKTSYHAYTLAFCMLLVTLLFSTQSVGRYVDDEDPLFVVGSTSVSKLVEVIKEPFYKQTGINILIRPIGSEKGVVSIGEDVSDIGIISRYLTDEEQARWPNLAQITIAQDAIVFMTNTANTLANIDEQEIIALYTGKVATVDNGSLTLLSKGKHHGTHDVFLSYFGLDSMPAPLATNMLVFKQKGQNQLYGQAKAKAYDQINQAFANISRIEDAIAYESLGAYHVFKQSMQNSKAKLLSLNGIPPIKNSQPNPAYPFKRPFNVVIKPNADKSVSEFVSFLMSEKGQKLLADSFFIPLYDK
ncbi:substrate-binding domain-containing protein [Thalassotalea euphylliae]|uniref:substrate-binding domain-containing protein n=1 Tax=Thalassotalea euphylliae TaxID=1655234 RepID=UPI003627E3BA